MISCGVYRIFIQKQSSAGVLSRGKHFGKGVCSVKLPNGFIKVCSLFMSNVGRSTELNKYATLTERLKLFCTQNFLSYLRHGVSRIPLCLKEHSEQVVRMCTRQCECVLAHRIRRGQQMFSLYTKLWDEVALKQLVHKMKQQFSNRGKEFLLSIAGVTAYNWDKMRISDEEIFGYCNDIENVYRLRDSTVTCSHCHHRVAFDMQVPNIKYCYCSRAKIHSSAVDKEWSPFIERKDLIVWRREEPKHRGLYAYKVYGSYDDVTAHDFLCVQLDTEYRKEWDRTAVELTILDSDPTTHSDVIYWIMKWPRMFSNRDYVFNRRFSIDEEKKIMVVVNKGTEHPARPERRENIRVKEYWSSMVIRPHKHFSEPGIEFCLTYFDDPGVSIPSAITSWVAVSGLPDFMMRVREAARQLAVRRKTSQKPCIIFTSEPTEISKAGSGSNQGVPTENIPKVPTTNQPAHPDGQDGYLQLNTARLFL